MTVSIWKRAVPIPKPHHIVHAIYFARGKPAEVAPVECRCGWHGTVGGWDQHRKAEQRDGKASVSRAATELEQFERLPA